MREIAGDTILIPVGETSLNLKGVITLNPVGVTIWKALENAKSREEILTDILEEFDVSEETARADLEEFLTVLAEKGLITVSGCE